MKVEVRPSELIDAHEIVLREGDLQELDAVSGAPPALAIQRSIRASILCWTARVDGEIALVCGCGGDLVTGQGFAWMLSSDRLLDRPITFYRQSRAYIRWMGKAYSELSNMVDQRNEASIRWLQWLGAEFEPPVPYGRHGLPFLKFTLRPREV